MSKLFPLLDSDKNYVASKYLKTPFPKNFTYENCIVMFHSNIVISKNKIPKSHDAFYCVDFYETFNEKSLVNFDFKGFSPNGAFILKTDKVQSEIIINEIKSNTELYFKMFIEESDTL